MIGLQQPPGGMLFAQSFEGEVVGEHGVQAVMRVSGSEAGESRVLRLISPDFSQDHVARPHWAAAAVIL